MPDFLQFTLFPPGALQSSIITTVWVGVCVVVFLNARFGTTLAGLVVPGYLVPLFFVKPISAIVVLVEAYLTYGLAWLLANKLLVRLGYSEMFGRDRFFALILLSVLVRIALDFFLIPLLLENTGDLFANYDLKNNLQSFGLIIVALIANQMWMGGVAKGSKALFLYLFLTFAIIQWLLIPLTNFNIGGLNYMYEDLATSLLSSPKAYIILLTTAFIASRMNLLFGWEFNGILIPALLALQWYQPEKLAFTFIEAIVILLLGTFTMRLPIFRGATFEGGRLLLLFFNIGFIYKILLGFALIEFLPTAKISDYFGFGYVVSTLIAVKVFQKHIAIKMAASTIFTSFVGILLATVAGFLLTYTSIKEPLEASQAPTNKLLLSEKRPQAIYAEIRPSSFFSDIRPVTARAIDKETLARFIAATKNIGVIDNAETLKQIKDIAQQLQIDTWWLADNILIAHKIGIGFYAIRANAGSGLILEVPRARAELGTAPLGLALFEQLNAKALFIDLSYQLQASGDYVFDSLLEDGLFQAFHEAYSEHNVLQLRGELKVTEKRKRLRGIDNSPPNQLKVLRKLPHQLPIELLFSVVNELELHWVDDSINPQWQHDKFGIAELTLDYREMRSTLARVEVYSENANNDDVNSVEGYLISWLLERKKQVARKGSQGYLIPSENELLYWHQDILLPLMNWVQAFTLEGWNQQSENELQRLNSLAGGLGYELRVLQQPLSGHSFLVLQEQIADPNEDGNTRKNWATLVVNLQAKNNYLIKVPNPFFEKTSFEFGAALFDQLQSRFLLLSGTHPWSNQDGSSNVTLPGNTQTLYHTMFMAIAKEYEKQNLTPIQIRGFSFQESRPFPQEHAMIGLWRNINQYGIKSSYSQLLTQLDDFGLQYRFVDGDYITAPYYLSTSQQIDYLNFLQLDEFITLWISPLVRDSFKATEAIKVEEQHARLINLPIYRQDIRSFNLTNSNLLDISADALSALQNYAKSRSVQSLFHASTLVTNHSLAYLLDSATLQQYIIVLAEDRTLLAAINLNSLNQTITTTTSVNAIETFVGARNLWLIPGNKGIR